MVFEKDQRLRRFVNNNRLEFIATLNTDLFKDGFPNLYQSTREKIGCCLRNDGPTAANSDLIDAIMKVEDFPHKFIKFCRDHEQCSELSERMQMELECYEEETVQRGSSRENPSNEIGCHSAENRTQSNIKGPSQEPGNNQETSSFYVENCSSSGKEHTIDIKSLKEPRKVQHSYKSFNMASLKFCGIQCVDDPLRVQGEDERDGHATDFDTLTQKPNSEADCKGSDLCQQTYKKLSLQNEDPVPKKEQVTYFTLTPCDVLGMSLNLSSSGETKPMNNTVSVVNTEMESNEEMTSQNMSVSCPNRFSDSSLEEESEESIDEEIHTQLEPMTMRDELGEQNVTGTPQLHFKSLDLALSLRCDWLTSASLQKSGPVPQM
ncbi:hypothetical protein PoB_003049200 [Plakobranchus ocellatus]|uniref:Uncharacterized protein n=1 Tax=Plakobranchus ocellatus TaxID=259542 RepID=A0AAV4AAV1_9GAST|nr:hypothetical protein PoB_003049200 [Plakobranchus ocellatus]